MLLGLFLLLFFILIVAPFQVEVELTMEGQDVQPVLRLGLAGMFLAIPKHLMGSMAQKVRERNLQNPKQALRSLQLGLRLMDSFLQTVELFHLQAIIGIGDPLFSALGCGGFWSILGPFFAGLSASNRLKTVPKVTVRPDYEKVRLGLYLHCIFQFRLGQIIINELRRAAVALRARTTG
jgi:hypothetical protein